ncbi:MAG TPA: L,D-transpeptidase [Longimicrobium sp.]|jgi:lipoprotein-anchoring transpeptidase ErfK/SrfK
MKSTLSMLLGAAMLTGAVEAEAQGAARRAPAVTRPRAEVPAQRPAVRVRSEAVARGRHVVVIDLDSNRLLFTKGRRVLWSAPVGTGTGLRMETDRDAWNFHTPNGTFHVTYKAREPDWIAPDWYFLENDLPVPPENSTKRRFPRGLGAAAVYLGHGLAIHGTDKPELLGQRVSHGCIRLSDADALRLFHNVQVGTEVVVVGGTGEPVAAPPRRRASSRPAGTPPPRDPVVVELEREETGALLAQLDRELFATAFADAGPGWPRVASVLLFRGIRDDDDEALGGLLARVNEIGPGTLRDEYATFISDAFAQSPLRTLAVMGQLDRTLRTSVASAIVDATVALYPGETSDARLPWPTKRAPRTVLDTRSQRGWDSLAGAERAYREARGVALR